MADLVTIAEATQTSTYSHEHIKWLVRTGRISGRKSGSLWLVDLKSLKRYEEDMEKLGDKKFTPKST